MKKLIYILLVLLAAQSSQLAAQSTGAVVSGNTLLVPRVTRSYFTTPHRGLIIYDTVANGFFGYIDSAWIPLDSISNLTTLFIDATLGGGHYNPNELDKTIGADTITYIATKWDLTQLGLGTTIITDSSQLLPTYDVDSLSNVLEASASAGHNILIWTGATGGLIARINDIAEFNGTIYNYVVPHNGDIARTNFESQLNGKDEFYQYDSIHVRWNLLGYPVMNRGNYQLAQLVAGTRYAYPMVFITRGIRRDSIDKNGNWYNLKLKNSPSNNYLKVDSATGRYDVNTFDPLNGVVANSDTALFDANGYANLGTISSGSGTFNFDSALATKTTDNLTQGVTNLYNQTHTGDATGATALTVVGIRSKSIPTLSAGNLKYNGTAWVFDNTTYLSSYTETDPVYTANGVPKTTTISTTAPLTGGGDLSANRTFAITQATTSTNGYLSSTDWNTFNNKIGDTAAINAEIVQLRSAVLLKLNISALDGGTTGQVLTKNSNTNQDYSWQTPSAGASGFTYVLPVAATSNGQTVFTFSGASIPTNPYQVQVFVNGIKWDDTTGYTRTSSTQITVTATDLVIGDKVTLQY